MARILISHATILARGISPSWSQVFLIVHRTCIRHLILIPEPDTRARSARFTALIIEEVDHEGIDPGFDDEPLGRHGLLTDDCPAGNDQPLLDPDRHPADLQEPGGAGLDFLQRYAAQG